jgi:polyvinyl alcohol dehydrogenase (cytochrome)
MTLRLLLSLSLGACALFAQDGAAVYKAHCASCHDMPTGRVPAFSALRAMTPALLVRALEGGVMKTQAEGLTSAERYALVGYIAIAQATKPASLPASAFCGTAAEAFPDPSKGPHWTGWSTDATNTRFQEAAGAGIAATDVPKLKLKWAFSLGDGIMARSQPSIAGGRVFVGSQAGAVYSLDARSGCIHWSFDAETGVRSAITIGSPAGQASKPMAYFGAGTNVYALDAATGKLAWKVHVEDHFAAFITGAPLLRAGVLYVGVSSGEEALGPAPSYECCTFRGSVVALDAATGKQVWKTYTIAEAAQATKKNKSGAQLFGPSGAGVWSTPTFDERRDALYIGTGDNYSDPPTRTSDAVMALDRKSGKILWSRQLTAGDAFNNSCVAPPKINCPESEGGDFDFGQPPMLVALPNGKRALVIGQKSGMAHALDPDQQGEVLWQTRVGKGSFLGGSQWGSAADRDNMYVAISDVQIVPMLDPKSPQGFSLGLDPKQGGGLHALRLSNGQEVWNAKPILACGDRKNCSPAQSADVTAIPGAVFSGAIDGHLRAYATASGEVIWDVDTVRDYDTVNGLKAHGGSLDGAGPTVAGGMLYVNSGYGAFGGTPGNVLLAFSVDGK